MVRINKSTEQGIIVLLMLGLQKDGQPVDSQSLSTVMGVSDSYLKKTLRKLTIAGLITSSAGREGGFTLARPLDSITLGDAFRALDPDSFVFPGSSIAEEVFEGCDQLSKSQWRIAQIFQESGDAFRKQLDEHLLTELLKTDAWHERPRDWIAAARALKDADQ